MHRCRPSQSQGSHPNARIKKSGLFQDSSALEIPKKSGTILVLFQPQTTNLTAIFGPKMQMSRQETQIAALAAVSILTEIASLVHRN